MLIASYSPSEDVLIDDFMTSFKTNTVGPILATNAFLPLIRKGTLKKVLSLSSAAADPAFIAKAEEASAPSYCITKTGIEMVMLTYALEYKREGVVFLAISPGIVNTADAPPPPDVLPKILAMRAAFQRVAPHWTGPMQPEESVRLMLGVLDRATIEDSGSFVSHLVSHARVCSPCPHLRAGYTPVALDLMLLQQRRTCRCTILRAACPLSLSL